MNTCVIKIKQTNLIRILIQGMPLAEKRNKNEIKITFQNRNSFKIFVIKFLDFIGYKINTHFLALKHIAMNTQKVKITDDNKSYGMGRFKMQ